MEAPQHEGSSEMHQLHVQASSSLNVPNKIRDRSVASSLAACIFFKPRDWDRVQGLGGSLGRQLGTQGQARARQELFRTWTLNSLAFGVCLKTS